MDYFIFQQINSLVGRFVCLDSLAIFFAEYCIYILAGLVFLVLWRRWGAIQRVFIATILVRLGIVELIRFFWQRPRPFPENTESSFPSGHAAFSFALSFVVYQYNKKAGIFFFTASFLIVISRVFLGIHWLSDIVAGALIGIFVGWLVLRIFRKKVASKIIP